MLNTLNPSFSTKISKMRSAVGLQSSREPNSISIQTRTVTGSITASVSEHQSPEQSLQLDSLSEHHPGVNESSLHHESSAKGAQPQPGYIHFPGFCTINEPPQLQ